MKMRVYKRRRQQFTFCVYLDCRGSRQILSDRGNSLALDTNVNVCPAIRKVCTPENEIHGREGNQ
jgi:hypothetical protein